DTSATGWDAIDASAVDVLRGAPCWMTTSERLVLYALVFGLRPRRYLEIGSFQGGSAMIVAAALEASRNPGRMVCVDPEPRIAPEHWRRVEARATLITGASPDVLPRARSVAGGRFDFALVDGDHTHDGVRRDLDGIVEHLEDRAHLLCHDGYH